MKQLWDALLSTSTTLATILAFSVAAALLMVVFLVIVTITKILVYIK